MVYTIHLIIANCLYWNKFRVNYRISVNSVHPWIVSYILWFTVILLNPKTQIMPAIEPMVRAAHGPTSKSATAPMATPPARVAFWMCSMTNFLLGFIHADNANVVTTQAHKLKSKLKYQIEFMMSDDPARVKQLVMLSFQRRINYINTIKLMFRNVCFCEKK